MQIRLLGDKPVRKQPINKKISRIIATVSTCGIAFAISICVNVLINHEDLPDVIAYTISCIIVIILILLLYFFHSNRYNGKRFPYKSENKKLTVNIFNKFQYEFYPKATIYVFVNLFIFAGGLAAFFLMFTQNNDLLMRYTVYTLFTILNLWATG